MDGSTPVTPEQPAADSGGEDESRPSSVFVARMVRNILANEFNLTDTTRNGLRTAIKQAIHDEVAKAIREPGTMQTLIAGAVVEVVFGKNRYQSATERMRAALQEAFKQEAARILRENLEVTLKVKG